MSKIIAIIPARGGSKRLPGKNKKDFCGKPLVCWSVEVAMKTGFISEIIITTDDLDIIKICQKYHYDNRVRVHERPKELAQDDTKMWEVVVDALKGYKNLDNIVVLLLQPTSPLRTLLDVNNCIRIYNQTQLPLLSVSDDGSLGWEPNGAVYIDKYWSIEGNQGFYEQAMLLYVMPEKRSVDVDRLVDFELAEKYMERRLKNENI